MGYTQEIAMAKREAEKANEECKRLQEQLEKSKLQASKLEESQATAAKNQVEAALARNEARETRKERKEALEALNRQLEDMLTEQTRLAAEKAKQKLAQKLVRTTDKCSFPEAGRSLTLPEARVTKRSRKRTRRQSVKTVEINESPVESVMDARPFRPLRDDRIPTPSRSSIATARRLSNESPGKIEIPVSGWTHNVTKTAKGHSRKRPTGKPQNAPAKKKHRLVGKVGVVKKVTLKKVKGRELQVMKVQWSSKAQDWVRCEDRVRVGDRVVVKSVNGITRGQILKVTLRVERSSSSGETRSTSSSSSWEDSNSWDARDSWLHGSTGKKTVKRGRFQIGEMHLDNSWN